MKLSSILTEADEWVEPLKRVVNDLTAYITAHYTVGKVRQLAPLWITRVTRTVHVEFNINSEEYGVLIQDGYIKVVYEGAAKTNAYSAEPDFDACWAVDQVQDELRQVVAKLFLQHLGQHDTIKLLLGWIKTDKIPVADILEYIENIKSIQSWPDLEQLYNYLRKTK